MAAHSLSLTLSTDDATARAAEELAPLLAAGDVILLSGPVGAGKTHFARHLIQTILTQPEDVPSPTFTLVQTYETRAGPLWHSDLYRIGTVDEIEELGLTEAFDTAICLVEWPDRLGPLRPDAALDIQLDYATDDDTRLLTAHWADARWNNKLKCWAK
ncbi:tRNA (adenosine(37)-N6)-threonylcarbamoyltransferase complex ATPase subunit type 1 TsaE [uncultured Roseobacter sp.]|uniref:tRNA (adenosine(37)-N6)-threonylcarbamoyltransferase complex ATPase subunit type 1 TsaE n=1 Tax=uncultured Roseobacter sp. TaxID=114847 RepID=UPI00261F2BEE|nr:tRNA (adenosine(37)-N6)-threonylcarbamoyltransferase complex ATPase subunit type 1 TsaE [uncultured Roseobacter sp.]